MSSPPDVELAELLNELFDVQEMQRFLRQYYRDVADCLPANLGRLPLASAAAEALSRRNLIDASLFARLHASRHRCTARIDRTAHTYERETTGGTASRRRVWGLAIVAGGGIAAGAAVMLKQNPTGPVRCEEDRLCEEAARPGEPYPESAASDAPAPVRAQLRCPAGMALIDAVGLARPLCLDRSEVTRGAFCSSPVGSTELEGSDRFSAARCLDPTERHPIAHVDKDEAAAYCAQRGLALPERRDYVRILHAELGGRVVASLLEAMNVCGAECHKDADPDGVEFRHVDPYERTAPVGRHRHLFGSPHGLDDMFGNVREMVRDGADVFGCGSGFLHSHFRDLDPEKCLAVNNAPLEPGFRSQSLGFRCAGEPSIVAQ